MTQTRTAAAKERWFQPGGNLCFPTPFRWVIYDELQRSSSILHVFDAFDGRLRAKKQMYKEWTKLWQKPRRKQWQWSQKAGKDCTAMLKSWLWLLWMILGLRASAGLNIRIAVERDGKHQTGTLQGLLNRSSKAQVLVGLLEQLATGIWDDKTHRTGISHHPPFFLIFFPSLFPPERSQVMLPAQRTWSRAV